MYPRVLNLIFQKDIKELSKTNLNLHDFNSHGDFLCSSPFYFKLILSLFFGLIFLVPNLDAQVRKELEERRQRLIDEIKITTNLLDKTTESKAAALSRYVTLQKQIQKREQLLETLRQEISFTNQSVDRATEVIEALTIDIENLKADYSSLMREAYRQKKNSSNFTFLFSSKSLNQVFKRWQYLKQYDQYRKRQALLILQTQETLSNKKTQLEEAKKSKEKLLASSERQTQILGFDLGDKQRIFKTLRKDESRLKRELREQRKNHEGLNKAIEGTIREEVVARRKRERSNQPLNSKPSSPDDPNSLKNLTSSFQSKRGQLIMPVQNGVITKRFGKQPHPTLRKIEITNNGIDIRTDNGADVNAVFEGKVISQQFIPGYQNMLIIQHGEYYTVYSNLETVYVKKGEQVGTLQAIGKVSINRKSKISEVHFEVWRDKVRLNPEDWVR